MPRAFTWIAVAAAACVAGAAVRAQTPAAGPPSSRATAQPPSSGFTTSTTAVVVDVVVRDSKGAPVLDLKPGDFELLEDGVRQRIAAVELVAPGVARRPSPARGGATDRSSEPPEAPSGAGSEAPPGGPTVIALVFHRL